MSPLDLEHFLFFVTDQDLGKVCCPSSRQLFVFEFWTGLEERGLRSEISREMP